MLSIARSSTEIKPSLLLRCHLSVMLLMKALKLGKAESTIQLFPKKKKSIKWIYSTISKLKTANFKHTFLDFTQDLTTQVSTKSIHLQCRIQGFQNISQATTAHHLLLSQDIQFSQTQLILNFNGSNILTSFIWDLSWDISSQKPFEKVGN